MKFYIKNMVCNRCKMVVRDLFEKEGLQPITVELGEVETRQPLSSAALGKLETDLKKLGFELIDDKKSRLIEQVKNHIVTLVHHSGEQLPVNLSAYISAKLHYEYNYISNLFSEVAGTTIEKYYIAQRIERVKELLVYNELSLSEIADNMGYSSVAYLSAQFKKVTGLTPSFYRSLKEHKRKNIDDL